MKREGLTVKTFDKTIVSKWWPVMTDQEVSTTTTEALQRTGESMS